MIAPDDQSPQEPEQEILPEEHAEEEAEFKIKPRHIVFVILILILIGAISYGGLKLFQYITTRKPSDEKKMETVQTITGITETVRIGTPDSRKLIIVGETGIAPAIQLGTASAQVEPSFEHIMLLRQLNNAFGVNVSALLNKTTDRRSAINSHLALLQFLFDKGVNATKTLPTEIVALQKQGEDLIKQRDVLDALFFKQLNDLEALAANQTLTEFIALNKKVAEIRARIKALQAIQERYVTSLPKVQQLIQDITLNKEALIAGIKVYDIRGSDINLILPTDGGVRDTQPSGDNQKQPEIRSPADIQTGRDFITRPGGGFSDTLQKKEK